MTDTEENTTELDPDLEEELRILEGDDSDEDGEPEQGDEPEAEDSSDEDPEEELESDGRWIGNRAVDIVVDGVKVKIRRGDLVKHPLPDDLAEKLESIGTIKKADS